jgi:hypothetical protein
LQLNISCILYQISKLCRSHLHHGGSLKSRRRFCVVIMCFVCHVLHPSPKKKNLIQPKEWLEAMKRSAPIRRPAACTCILFGDKRKLTHSHKHSDPVYETVPPTSLVFMKCCPLTVGTSIRFSQSRHKKKTFSTRKERGQTVNISPYFSLSHTYFNRRSHKMYRGVPIFNQSKQKTQLTTTKFAVYCRKQPPTRLLKCCTCFNVNKIRNDLGGPASSAVL